MQKINIVCVGRIKDTYICDAIDEYTKRLKRFCELKIIEVQDYPDTVDSIKKESALIIPKLSGTVYPMCIEGEQHTSEDFSRLFKDKSEVTFIIGGSNGLSNDIKDRGRMVSVSKMTFPHGLFRVILLEQIYRGFKITNNEKYHK